MYIHINHKCTLLKEQATQIGLCGTIIAYWGLQFLKAYEIKFSTEGHTIIYTCLHVIYKPQHTIIKYS